MTRPIALSGLPGATALMPRIIASLVRSTSRRDSSLDVAGEEGRVGVTVDATDERGDVDVDDVPVGDDGVVRDAVADDFVKRGAQRLGKAPVAEGAWVRAVIEQEFVSDAVQLVGRDARGDVLTDFG